MQLHRKQYLLTHIHACTHTTRTHAHTHTHTRTLFQSTPAIIVKLQLINTSTNFTILQISEELQNMQIQIDKRASQGAISIIKKLGYSFAKLKYHKSIIV